MLHTFAKQATEKQTLCHSTIHQHDQQAQTISSNAKGPQKDKTWQHSPKQTPNFVVYKDVFLHAPSQARRLRPNSLAKDAHNQF